MGTLRVRQVDFEPAHEPWGEYIANVGDDGTHLKARYTVMKLYAMCDEDGTPQRDAEGNILFYHQGEVQCVTRS